MLASLLMTLFDFWRTANNGFFRWLLSHKYIAMTFSFISLIIICVKGAVAAYHATFVYVVNNMAAFGSAITGAAVGVAAASGEPSSWFARANTILPLAESFSLLTVYVGLVIAALSWRALVWVYRFLPLKST